MLNNLDLICVSPIEAAPRNLLNAPVLHIKMFAELAEVSLWEAGPVIACTVPENSAEV